MSCALRIANKECPGETRIHRSQRTVRNRQLAPRNSELPLVSSRRTLKVAQAIRQVVSMAILTEIKDPRVRDVTVTAVEVTPDLRQARVFVSVRGDETKANLSLHGLRSAAGFLQSRIAERVDTRYTPKLIFAVDQGVKRSIEVQKMLREVLPADLTHGDEPSDAEALDEDSLDDGALDDDAFHGAPHTEEE